MSVILVQESPSDGGPTCISWRVATILYLQIKQRIRNPGKTGRPL